MDYRDFEQALLRIAFTTRVDLSPAALAFFTGTSVAEAEEHMQRLVSLGVLEVSTDDHGHTRYAMPDRPEEPVPPMILEDRPPAVPLAPGRKAPPRAIVVRTLHTPSRSATAGPITPGQAVSAMFLNAMVCPGVGSLVGGQTRAGLAQLSLFLLGIPLVLVAIGLPMVVAAWTWGIATGAQLIAEARS